MVPESLRRALDRALAALGAPGVEIRIERPRDPAHGDLATNVALSVASRLGRPPRRVAEEIAGRIDPEEAGVASVEVAGPGFINFRLAAREVVSILLDIVAADEGYGRSQVERGKTIMVEFVSANPTGPLHLGHGRQAALGDAIAALLEWTGWSVHREFYYNDAGAQIERLARSVWARYQQHLGRDAPVPGDGYHGEYVREIARDFAEEVRDRYLDDHSPEALEAMRRYAVRVMRADQDRDLTEFRVHFDSYYLESSLYTDGRVDNAIRCLREAGVTYERDGALWFAATRFADQKDRVMVRQDGTPTYFVPDVAYHLTKWERGFRHAINVQGADHHGTVARVRGALQALGLPAGYPEYVLHQMVTVEKGGREVKLSKRAGTYTTLRELFEEVGVDVTRYFFQMRRPEAHLAFDLDAALDQSEKNPVYKTQYAHARMCSIFRKGGMVPASITGEGVDLRLLSHERERELVKELAEFPAVVERTAATRAPHMICDYLERTAGTVNSWYHAGNPSRDPGLAVLVPDAELRAARLLLARAVQVVLRNALRILGIEAPERMIREEAAADVDEPARRAEPF
ncbi:MAG: arginine--tRNA ligase [Gemmatimonadetes bacterium]|nr:arginine--tRNA ligase [Gemmatimonadota bacterium]